MSETSFVLSEAPWIPCETAAGERVELGIRDALVRAHELRSVADPSPLVTAALHRLLLAVLHRCFGPADVASWKALHAAGRFDAATIDAYLGRWRHRLDLVHPETPFYQVRGLPDADDALTCMLAERSAWGPGVAVFEHRPEAWEDALTFAEAARALVTFHAYAPAGLVRKPGEPTSASAGPLQRGLVVLAQGRSLFETLLFNLLVYDDERPLPARDDAPSWECDPLPRQLERADEPRRAVRGWLDLLTWQSRRVELKVRGDRVTGMIRRVGQGLGGDVPRDPMMAWRRHEKWGLVPLVLDPERAFWRECHTLFQTQHHRDIERPAVLGQLARDEVATVVGRERRFALMVCGLAADKASILMVRAEHLPVSPKLLADPALGEIVEDVLQVAEAVEKLLEGATWTLARHALSVGEREPAAKDIRSLMDELGTGLRYWAVLRGGFDSFLDGLAVDDGSAASGFCDTAVKAARRALTAGARALGTTGRAEKAGAIAQAKLTATMKDVIPERYRAPAEVTT